jgi:SPP1 gp7 family putative phage head morphogenesis protein
VFERGEPFARRIRRLIRKQEQWFLKEAWLIVNGSGSQADKIARIEELELPFRKRIRKEMLNLMVEGYRQGRGFGRQRTGSQDWRKEAFLARVQKGKVAIQELQPDPTALDYSSILKEYRAYVTGLADEYYAETIRATKRTIIDAIRNGEEWRDTKTLTGKIVPGVRSKLASTFADAEGYKLERKFRTEMTRAVNRGALKEYKRDKMVRGVVFVAVMDSRTSDICEALDGVRFDIDDPRLERYTPPLHANCRSMLEPLFVFDEGEIDADESRDIELTRPTGEKNVKLRKMRPTEVRYDFSSAKGSDIVVRGQKIPSDFKPKTRRQALKDFLKKRKRG